MIWTTLLGKLISGVGQAWQEKREAEHKQYLAELAAGIHDPNKLRWLKWATFLQFSAPLYLTFFYPAEMTLFMKNLNELPDWYIEAYLMIVGGVWASAVGKDIVQGLIKRRVKAAKQDR